MQEGSIITQIKKRCLKALLSSACICLAVLAYESAERPLEYRNKFVRGHRNLATKVSKARRVRSFTFTIESWEMSIDDGDHMTTMCNYRPRFVVYIQRTYHGRDDATKLIKMCQPAPTIDYNDGSIQFHNGVAMEKDEVRSVYSLSGDVLLNDEDDKCDFHADCKDGLYCDGGWCKSLPSTSCFMERESRDCLLLGIPLQTKCYAVESLFGGSCGCDNDPLANPCQDESHTCDFDCQTADAVAQCKSPAERNQLCVDFTGDRESVCQTGDTSCPSCT